MPSEIPGTDPFAESFDSAVGASCTGFVDVLTGVLSAEPYAIAATRSDCSRSLSGVRGDRVVRIASNLDQRPPIVFSEGDDS